MNGYYIPISCGGGIPPNFLAMNLSRTNRNNSFVVLLIIEQGVPSPGSFAPERCHPRGVPPSQIIDVLVNTLNYKIRKKYFIPIFCVFYSFLVLSSCMIYRPLITNS